MSWMLVAMLKVTVVLAMTGIVTGLMRSASASARHLVWCAGLGAALLVPVLSVIAPRWSVPAGSVFAELSAPPTWALAPAAPETPVPVLSQTPAVSSTGVSQLRSPSARATTVLAPRATGVAATSEESVPVPARAELAVSTSAYGVSPLSRPTVSWQMIVLVGWGVGALLLLAVVFGSVTGLAHLERGATPVRNPRVIRLARRLVQRMGIRRPVRILTTTEARMPMTWGALDPSILLPGASSEWTSDRLEAVLLHELAHVKRWDYATQMMARLACTVYWFNPVVWLAARALRIERERACDDAVLKSGSKASTYAGHLLEIARSLRGGALSSVASVAMAKPSQLSGRLLAVLDAHRDRGSVSKRTVLAAIVIAVLVAVPLAGATPSVDVETSTEDSVGRAVADSPEASVAVASGARSVGSGSLEEVWAPREAMRALQPLPPLLQQCDWDDSSGKRSSSTQINDDRIRIRIEVGDCELQVDADGRISFADDESDVVAITNGGYLEIEERVGRRSRALTIASDGGQLTREWKVDGAVQPYGGAAREWLADMLPTLFRLTGIDAEERAARIYERAGADGLLQEISLIPSDHVARKYFSVLLSQGDLDAATMSRLVRQAGNEISSDYELAELLIYVAENQPLDENVRVVYVEATSSIASDYEHRRALSAVLQRDGITGELADAMLRTATQIGSDYELAELLIELLERHPIDEALTGAFLEAVGTIGSDHERGRVIRKALEQGAPNTVILDGVLALAQAMSSDYEVAELLLFVVEQYPIDRALPQAYLDAARSVGSDHELSRVLLTLVQRDRLSREALVDVLTVSESLSSDYEMSQLLKAIGESYALTGPVQQAYFASLGRVGSDWEHGQILQLLLEGDLTPELVRAILESAASIGSDFELAELLVGLAERYGVPDELRDSFMRAANQIGSTYERGRVLDAAFPRSQN